MAVKNFLVKIKSKNFALFVVGAWAGLLLLGLVFWTGFEIRYKNRVYPGVRVAGQNLGGQTKLEVRQYFAKENARFAGQNFTFIFEEKVATISGEKLRVGFNEELLAEQAYLIGRSGNMPSALYQKWASQKGLINLSPAYNFDEGQLEKFLVGFAQEIDIPAQEPLFAFAEGRVIAFRPAKPGQALDRQKARQDFAKLTSPPTSGTVSLSVVPVEPKVKTGQVNNLGIKELLGRGLSFFAGSIPNRVHNIALASSRLNGVLIAPGEIFSFNKALGEVSAETGYKQAYVIKERRTILDDGGGVCQVSTTLFRAALEAGLSIEERRAHAYRVSYYEQGGFGPGLDATVYAPSVDLKIKNETPAYILIQARVESKNANLTIELYGTGDGRKAMVGKPRVWNEVPAPEPLYQDDPNLAKGQLKQIDFAARGAKTAFDWQVERNGEILQNRIFYSNFIPWQAVYLRGTKE